MTSKTKETLATLIPTGKEMTVVKTSATKAINEANALKVSKDEDLDVATDLLSRIRKGRKIVKARREKITKPMMGFKAFHSASATIAGIETAHMIRKGQLFEESLPAHKQFMALAA